MNYTETTSITKTLYSAAEELKITSSEQSQKIIYAHLVHETFS